MWTDQELSQTLTLLFAIPLLLSSIYGMNIPLPFQDRKWAFHAYVVICLVWWLSVLVFTIVSKQIRR